MAAFHMESPSMRKLQVAFAAPDPASGLPSLAGTKSVERMSF